VERSWRGEGQALAALLKGLEQTAFGGISKYEMANGGRGVTPFKKTV